MSSSAIKQSAVAPGADTGERAKTGQAPQEPAPGSERQAMVLRVLWESRRLLMRAAAIGLLASTLVALLIPKSYTATGQLMPPDTQSSPGMAMMASLAAQVGGGGGGGGGGNAGGGLASLAGDLLGLKNSGALFIGILRSQTSQERLVREFALQKVYREKLVTDARTKLDDNTAISEDRKSGIITIRVTDHDPERAAAITNAYVGQLNSLVAELSTSAAHRERVFLEERLVVVKHGLDEATNQLAQFSSKNNTLDMQTEGRAMLDAAGGLAGQMIAAQSELEGLRQIYTADNARVRALNARVSELRNQLNKLGGSTADPAKASDAPPEVSSGMPYPTIRNLPLLGAKYADYFRQAKIQETVFQLLTEQSELAKVQEAKETPSVKVLDPAQVPEKRSAPARLLIILLGSFLAFSGAVVWVLGAEQWRGTDPDDPRKILAQEVAATLKMRAQRLSRSSAGRDAGQGNDSDRLDDLQPPTDRSERA
jgi:uncharacterized protein involved in exopolysaccharide biosynthesis